MSRALLKKTEVRQFPNVLLAKDRAALTFFSEQMANQKVFSALGGLGENLVSHTTSEFQKSIQSLVSIKSPSTQAISEHKTLSEKLYDATSEVKILTSQVSMYLTREWRDRVFKQLDNMHDISEWDADTSPIQKESYKTFLKLVISLKPNKHPGLGLSDKGFLLAAWIVGGDRLTTEFLPNDNIRWTLSTLVDGEIDRAAGVTKVSRLFLNLLPYQPNKWFYENTHQKG